MPRFPVALTFVALLSAIPSGGAMANWIHQEHASAFSSGATHLALTGSGNYGFGLRCTGPLDLTAIFITPEQADADSVAAINRLSPELLVRVDNNGPHTLSAQSDVVDLGMSIYADANVLLARELMSAGSRVSVAISLLGTLYQETQFDVRGSTAAVNAMVAGCGIQLD